MHAILRIGAWLLVENPVSMLCLSLHDFFFLLGDATDADASSFFFLPSLILPPNYDIFLSHWSEFEPLTFSL